MPSVEVRAALGVLDQANKATELVDLEARIRTLEELLERQAGRSGASTVAPRHLKFR